MHPIVYILISVVVAACIGGITNYLAIKMLFYPRFERHIAGWKVPFTPGLIPKRRDDIARSLGDVVGSYLVTSEGLTGTLMKPEFKLKLENKLRQWFSEWSNKEGTLRQLALRFWTETELKVYEQRLVQSLREITAHGVGWLWKRQEQALLKLGDVVPGWDRKKKEQLVQWITDYIIAELDKELNSFAVDRLLRQLTGNVMQHAGGMLGALAGIFMDEEKVIARIKIMIGQKLASPEVRAMLMEFIERKINEWEAMSLTDVLETLAKGALGKELHSKEEVKDWIVGQVSHVMKWDDWLERVGQVELRHVISDRAKTWIDGKVPTVVEGLLRLLASNLERMITAVELPKLVEEQVSRFPIERIEQIVLSVSGREFRAITWLGALLGGMIGLFQAILLRWFV